MPIKKKKKKKNRLLAGENTRCENGKTGGGAKEKM